MCAFVSNPAQTRGFRPEPVEGKPAPRGDRCHPLPSAGIQGAMRALRAVRRVYSTEHEKMMRLWLRSTANGALCKVLDAEGQNPSPGVGRGSDGDSAISP